MEFPQDVLRIIRAFAKPIGTRKDWRSCKQHEAMLIWRHNEFNLHLCNYHFQYTQTINREIIEWTLFGRKRTLQNILRYPDFWLPVMPEHDWYENRLAHYDWQTDELDTQVTLHVTLEN